MAAFETAEVGKKYHDAIVAWQRKNFPELDLLEKNWTKHFKKQTPFQLTAKIGKIRSDDIEFGALAGQKKFEKAGKLRGGMFYGALGIIKAQCSTEFGSIQQHRETLEGATDDYSKYAVMRIMAEELRHAYQMFWVLEHDPSWKKLGMGDVASETMDELLAMETGSHVLDAFNIHYRHFLDNVVFAAIIDLVGKYQLDMQRVFAYAPMARSMGPMYAEEGFHLATGKNELRKIARMALEGEGDFSHDEIQKTINFWLPRGVEMFGNEEGGQTSVDFGFKDRLNGDAQSQYLADVQDIIDALNQDVVKAHHPETSAQEANEIIAKVQTENAAHKGVRPEELYYRPDRKFFRRRGPETVRFHPYDVHGELLTKDGVMLNDAEYYDYVATVLPEGYRKTSDFERHLELKRMEDAKDW